MPVALEHLRRRCEVTHLAFGLAPEAFSGAHLARALRALGSLDPPSDALRLTEAADLEPAGAPALRRLSHGRLLRSLHRALVLFPTR